MKKKFIYPALSLLALTACNNKDSLMIENFESGSFENWTIEFHNGDDSRGAHHRE